MKLLSFIASALILATPALAAKKPLATLLQEFDADSATFMDQIPQKSGKKPKFFSKSDIKNKNYIEAKNEGRKLRGRAEIEGNDRPEHLVDNGDSMITKLADMEKKKLLKAKIKTAPWSDHYWALYQGQLAFRYADSNFPNSDNWKKNKDFLMKNLFTVGGVPVENLSPAEKYDLLVGDRDAGLTKAALAQGEEYYNVNKKVESWMGICHGWAPASFMMDRPKRAVEATAADGTKIPFNPSDIKALASLLWATNAGSTNFIGGRCNTKEPKKNKEGRIVDDECFDTNPGSWHLAVVNQLGVSKRSFVMDAVMDYEVWNHPVYAYNYTYFNPQTLEPVKTLKEATVAMGDFTKDKFPSFRSKDAVAVVGVSMTVEYTVETTPSAAKTDGPSDDSTNSVSYQYDLEIDADGNIIGGEWYNNAHPDFLWTPTPDSRALTAGDEMLGNAKWKVNAAPSAEIQSVAQRTSPSGAPLAVIVEGLIKAASSGASGADEAAESGH